MKKKSMEGLSMLFPVHSKLLKVMKLSFLFSVLLTINITAAVSYSQATKLNLKMEDATLKELLTEIGKQSEFSFWYNNNEINDNQPISIDAHGETVDKILDIALEGKNLSYEINDKTIYIYAPKTSNGSANTSQQQHPVSGTVKDAETGETIIGANVMIKGTSLGTITDINGNFNLNVPDGEAAILVSYIGYIQEEVSITGLTSIEILLVPDIESLEEVVVIGYGTMDKTNVTGAISSLKTDELNKAPVPNMIEAMRGQVPGLRMTRSSGAPGSGVEFLIRGKNSLNSSNEPLIVIDGVPSTGGNLAELSNSDIESINILKDAAAASIYGARGANGVILVNTKSGNKGKPMLDVSISKGYTNLIHELNLMDADQYVQLKMDAAAGMGLNNNLEAVLTDAIEYANYTNPDGVQQIDWHDVILRTGQVTNAGVSLSGGTDKISFYLNGDAYLEDGIVQYSSYDRYSFRLNADYQPYKFIKIGARAQMSRSIADETGNRAVESPQGDPDFTDFLHNTPLGRLYNENNELVPTVRGDQFDYNPLYKYRESETDRITSRVLFNPYIEITPFEGFTYRLNASAEERHERYYRFTSSIYNSSTLSDEPGNNSMIMWHSQPITYLLDNILSYIKDFKKHKLDLTLVYGIQAYETDRMEVSGAATATDLLSYNSINTSELDYRRIIYTTDEWRNIYYVGRLGYSYDRRYVFTGTVRYDGSSVFGPEYRWGMFPSVSFAWNVNNESFMQNVDFINSLKYRVSWGRMGNDRIATYGYIATTDNVSYPFSEEVYSGLTSGNLPSEYLHWETSQQFNTGIDFAILNYRLTGSVDVYKTNTIGLILDRLIPPVTGFSDMVSNIGETENKGIEINLNYLVINSVFKWEISANWARDRNKIIRLNDAVDADGNLVDDVANGWFIGQDIDEIYNLDYVGVYQIGEEELAATMHPDKAYYSAGFPKIRDVDGDGLITMDDRTFLGNPTPDWYGGLRNTFSYKGIDLTILFEAVQGVTKINTFYGNLDGRSNSVVVDYWTPDNPTNVFPQPRAGRGYDYPDAVRVRDASYIALRNVSLSYAIPGKLADRAKISAMQLYLRGNNLRYFTDYMDAYSPEMGSGPYPITRNWTIGTHITF
ncbi:MAG: TonB-dependent receptor [Bacteroidales bacterium]|nr:TonB-dependent receptor [Bacteroidales bacterium]